LVNLGLLGLLSIYNLKKATGILGIMQDPQMIDQRRNYKWINILCYLANHFTKDVSIQ